MKVRLILISAFFTASFLALGANLYKYQIRNGADYVERAAARKELAEKLTMRRGGISITDKYQTVIPAAINKKFPIVYGNPKEIKDPVETAFALAPLVGKDAEELTEALNHPNLTFRLLLDRAPEETVAAVRNLGLTGIYTTEKEHRFYPFGELSAIALGFVGINEDHPEPTGLYGLERFYQAELAAGHGINLSLDRNIQTESEAIIQELVDNFQAEGGTVIVQETKTGRILALAQAPGFNPNSYGKAQLSSFTSDAIQKVYEPGSVFKPLTMAAGIDLGVITPHTTYFDAGSVTLNGETIKNWDLKANGRITMTQVIERSVNTGAVFAVRKIGVAQFVSYLKKFGFGEVTGIDFPDEVPGSLKNIDQPKTYDIDLAAASFGQGTAVTPIQMIAAFSALGNGGLLMRPTLLKDGQVKVVRRVVSEDAAAQVLSMMESAVDKAHVASLPRYRIAGKTGTAQVPDFRKGGYSDEYIHTFIGLGPVSNPRFTALIKLNKPNAVLAGVTVVPAFRRLAEFIMGYYNLLPDKVSD